MKFPVRIILSALYFFLKKASVFPFRFLGCSSYTSILVTSYSIGAWLYTKIEILAPLFYFEFFPLRVYNNEKSDGWRNKPFE